MAAAIRVPLLLALVLACDAEPPPGGADDGQAAADCADETRADDYAVGMVKAGAQVQVRLVEATPAPPDRGDNTWRVALGDGTGAPIAAEIAVDTFMPDHQHGSSIAAQVSAAPRPGEYVIAPVNLFMPGLWEVTLDLALAGGGDDAVVFRFCVDP